MLNITIGDKNMSTVVSGDTEMTRIAVFGAGGGQGAAIARAAHQAGHNVRILLRKPSTILTQLGHVAIGDMENSNDVDDIVAGSDVVLLTVPLVFDADRMARMARNVFQSIERHKVPRLVYNASTTTPDFSTGAPVLDTLRQLSQEALGLKSSTTVGQHCFWKICSHLGHSRSFSSMVWFPRRYLLTCRLHGSAKRSWDNWLLQPSGARPSLGNQSMWEDQKHSTARRLRDPSARRLALI